MSNLAWSAEMGDLSFCNEPYREKDGKLSFNFTIILDKETIEKSFCYFLKFANVDEARGLNNLIFQIFDSAGDSRHVFSESRGLRKYGFSRHDANLIIVESRRVA